MDKRIDFKIIVFILLIIIINVFVLYKNIYLYSHKAEIIEDYEEVMKGYFLKDTLTIKKKDADNYLELNGFKIRNDFSSYDLEERNSEDEAYRYVKTYDDGKEAVYFSKNEEIVKYFISDDVDFLDDDRKINAFKNVDRKKFLEKNNIKDDVDFLKFIRKNYYMSNNFLDSKVKINEAYVFNVFTGIMIPKISSYSIIDGDFRGYILNCDGMREVHILDNGYSYNVLLIGKELISDSYIRDLISTIVINN